jgi:hypothetical protein
LLQDSRALHVSPCARRSFTIILAERRYVNPIALFRIPIDCF